MVAAYRPRRELQKVAPRNFRCFFLPRKRGKKDNEIPVVPCREGAARSRNARLQQGDFFICMSQSGD